MFLFRNRIIIIFLRSSLKFDKDKNVPDAKGNIIIL